MSIYNTRLKSRIQNIPLASTVTEAYINEELLNSTVREGDDSFISTLSFDALSPPRIRKSLSNNNICEFNKLVEENSSLKETVEILQVNHLQMENAVIKKDEWIVKLEYEMDLLREQVASLSAKLVTENQEPTPANDTLIKSAYAEQEITNKFLTTIEVLEAHILALKNEIQDLKDVNKKLKTENLSTRIKVGDDKFQNTRSGCRCILPEIDGTKYTETCVPQKANLNKLEWSQANSYKTNTADHKSNKNRKPVCMQTSLKY